MNNKIKWGIIGLGKIANKFAKDLQLSKNSVLYGVASRSLEKAKVFSKKYRSIKYYSSYEALAEEPKLDVIYIATPHTFHFKNTMMCLKKGKAVLCEKPMGVSSNEVQVMLKEAKSKRLFLMEGLWTRFIPATEKLIELLTAKVIGDIIYIRADFGFKGDMNLKGRVYNKKLGGGSLLDIGIYPIYLSLITLGVPISIKAMGRMTKTNVDSFCSMLFDYKNSAKAILESTIEAPTPTEAYIFGKKGIIKLHNRFHCTEKITLLHYGKTEQVFSINYKGNGYLHEIEEVEKCLLSKRTESKKLTPNNSLQLIQIMDRVKNQIGLNYSSLKSSK